MIVKVFNIVIQWAPITRRNAGILRASENGRNIMAWNKPAIVEVCVAMEINGYMPIEF
ncbi:pyrroloquinoline quinone precursor peptide PqqA [Aureimonas altamirensis]|uniref:pyrroloquinoline quinone precursor peptide PqqA n=1 Tax=Aureimonas altamirensis TaxID=370622 RepID=UPI0020369BDB|nr:pyrroloquinoline quinone precursor peptide PqqA [Aureimonas altamirensis]